MIYEYECQTCKRRTTANRSIAERNNGPECCGEPSKKRIFTATPFQGVEWNVDYFCPALGEGISSKRQRESLMAQRGLSYADDFGEPDFEAMKDKADAVQNYVPKSQAPAELKDAMVREGLDNLL